MNGVKHYLRGQFDGEARLAVGLHNFGLLPNDNAPKFFGGAKPITQTRLYFASQYEQFTISDSAETARFRFICFIEDMQVLQASELT
jgi:hypothetical protein